MLSVEELAFRAGFTGQNLDNTQIGTAYSTAIANLVQLVREEKDVLVKEQKEIWVVYNNTDLNEGRGRQYAQHICELKATADRLAEYAGVQGSNAKVRKDSLIKIGDIWYAPSNVVDVIQPSREDLAKESEEVRKNALLRRKQEVIQKARLLGLTAEELELLKV